MSPWVEEWVGLVVRWFHLAIGIAWIGASFYFVWLNNAVRPPERGPRPGVAGEVWSVHGGAFYQVVKYKGAPEALPGTLHWFKWEAYLTWLSGFFLLVFLYWRNAATWMIDAAVMPLAPWQAVAVGAGTLLGGWLVYDGLCRSPLARQPGAMAGVLLGFVAVVAWGLFQVLSARAATIHVGAMMGTWMAANVLFVIIPGQRAMVDAMIAGREPPVERGAAGAMRSLHNNYFTLGVLFTMISSHFPGAWSHAWGWVSVTGLALAGALLRHSINLHEQGRPARWMAPTAWAVLLLVAIGARPTAPAAPADAAETIKTAQVQQIIAARCLSCHASEPFHPGFPTPPKDVVLESPEHLLRWRERIGTQVATKVMPLGNLTGMTDEERALVVRWAEQEAPATAGP